MEAKFNDDFNTAQAIAVLFENLREVKKAINSGDTPSNIDELHTFLKEMADDVMGLWPESDANESMADDRTDELLNILIEMRNRARRDKQFELADEIRDRLADHGIELRDSHGKTSYKIHNKK